MWSVPKEALDIVERAGHRQRTRNSLDVAVPCHHGDVIFFEFWQRPFTVSSAKRRG